MQARRLTRSTAVAGLAVALLIGLFPGVAEAQKAATTHAPQLTRADVVVFATLGIAVVFMFILVEKLSDRLGKRLGPANWSFKDSWASNLTVVGGILGTLLASGVLPDPTRHLTKQTYAGLNLMFTVITVIAGFVYLAVRKEVQVTTRGGTEPQYQGYVLTFLLASMLTMWAVLGQLATIFLLLDEIRAQGALSLGPMAVFTGVLAIAVCAVFAYAWTTITSIVRRETDTDTRKRQQALELRRYGRDVDETAVEPQLAPVSIL